jgi:uroporphyrinogen-III synthase
MRVLVTRPKTAAERTAAHLRAAGHVAIIAPLLDYGATGETWPNGLFDGLIATSAAAFTTQGAATPCPEVRRLLPLFLVGEQTADAARNAGFDGAATVCPDSQALLATLWPRVHRHRLLYVAGRDRKPHVETALREARHLSVLEGYEAHAAAFLPLAAAVELGAGRIDAVLHFSRRSADVFLALAGAEAAGPAHLCLSVDAAAPLIAADLPRVQAAARPDEAALFALLDSPTSDDIRSRST